MRKFLLSTDPLSNYPRPHDEKVLKKVLSRLPISEGEFSHLLAWAKTAKVGRVLEFSLGHLVRTSSWEDLEGEDELTIRNLENSTIH